MITSAIIYVFGWMLSGVVFALPSGTILPTGITDMISMVVDYAYGLDWLVPMATVFNVLSAILIFFLAEITWRGSKWFAEYLRGN